MSGLRVNDLSVAYGSARQPITAVNAVSFDVAAGTKLGLVGESGSGKTTTALAILRLLRPPGRITGGAATIDGTDLLALAPRELRKSRLRLASYIPQGAMNALNPVLTIGDQFAGVLADHGEATTGRHVRDRAAAALHDVGLPDALVDRYPHQLSGGQKQRICIALGLILSPRLIIADEPTSALDVITQRQVMETLGRQQSGLGSALVLIGHDIGLMAQFVDHLAIMYAGRIVEMGPIDAMIRTPRHPYTQALVTSVPTLDQRGTFTGIPGVTPSLSDLPTGCAFHPRCARRDKGCDTERPTLRPVPGGTSAACHYAESAA
jgi:oligopeptide/dipeptide ABC transporter ATP-binding protein